MPTKHEERPSCGINNSFLHNYQSLRSQKRHCFAHQAWRKAMLSHKEHKISVFCIISYHYPRIQIIDITYKTPKIQIQTHLYPTSLKRDYFETLLHWIWMVHMLFIVFITKIWVLKLQKTPEMPNCSIMKTPQP